LYKPAGHHFVDAAGDTSWTNHAERIALASAKRFQRRACVSSTCQQPRGSEPREERAEDQTGARWDSPLGGERFSRSPHGKRPAEGAAFKVGCERRTHGYGVE